MIVIHANTMLHTGMGGEPRTSHVTAGDTATLGTDWQPLATLQVHSAWDAGMQLLNIHQREVQAHVEKPYNVESLFLTLKNSESL